MYDFQSIYCAESVADAVWALTENPEAVLISGGTDVLVQIREGRLAGRSLVSVHGLPELNGVELTEDGTLVIGAATSFYHITESPLVRQYLPMLAEAVDQVGGPQIRRTGTIGGNVCNGVTSADSASTLLACNAVFEVTGPEGTRRIPMREWYTGPGKTVRAHNEILTAVRISKADYEGFGGHYIKYGKRNAMEIATLGCAVRVKVTADQTHVEDLRIAYGVAAPTPIRCVQTEQAAAGMEIGPELFVQVGQGVLSEVNPRSSWRASKEFRLQLVKELAGRALYQALLKAGAEEERTGRYWKEAGYPGGEADA